MKKFLISSIAAGLILISVCQAQESSSDEREKPKLG